MKSIFLIILIVPIVLASPIEEEDHIPRFKNGRPKHGFLGSPHVKHSENFKSATPQWFTQKLNHFDDSDSRTWQQRYFVNASSFAFDGPVFLMIGGEGPLSPNWVSVGTMVEYAAEYKALVVAVEHRFYGESHPLGDMSTDSLKYLSSEQALADLASFREAMVKQFSLTSKNLWIAFGGSYPGALSAWFRTKYPHLVHGSVATSAPIFAQLDFPQYLEVATDSLTDDSCQVNVRTATDALGNYTLTEAGLKYLSARFRTCKPLTSNQFDIQNFAEAIAGNFFGVVQYNKDNREFEGAVGTNITISVLCSIMNNATLGDSIERYAIINDLMLHTYGSKCVDTTYDDYVTSMQKTDWKSSAAEGGRQWLYQTCTEFGFYQTTDSPKQVYGSLFPLSFSLKQCMDIFGEQFNATNINRGIDWTNANYGGYGMTATRIIFPNGSIDPWHALSFTEDTKDLIAIFIKGTAHCANMYPSGPNDSEELVAAKQKINALIGEWLASPDVHYHN